MFVVAIHDTAPADGSRAGDLAAALGVTAYDARPRVMSPGPCVVHVCGGLEEARATAARLTEAGFRALVRDTAALGRPERTLPLRTFTFAPDLWRVATRQGREVALRYADLVALVVGTHVVTHTSTSVVKQQKRAMGRAMLSGGLVTSKTVKRQVTTTEQERQRFLRAYARGGGVVVMMETETDYAGLGDELQPARPANFTRTLERLRERAPQAAFDDQLLTVAGQRQVLGPQLDPLEHVDLAAALVASVRLLG